MGHSQTVRDAWGGVRTTACGHHASHVSGWHRVSLDQRKSCGHITGISQRIAHNRNTTGENLNSADRWSDVPAGTMDEASPIRPLMSAVSLTARTRRQIGPPHPPDPIMGGPSADPEEKRGLPAAPTGQSVSNAYGIGSRGVVGRDSNLCILESEFGKTLSPGGKTRTCASRIKGVRATWFFVTADYAFGPDSPAGAAGFEPLHLSLRCLPASA